MNHDFKMEDEVMRRVRMIHLFRRLSHPSVIKVTALVFFGLVVSIKVSLMNVFYNMPRWNDAEGLYNFYTTAFNQTEMVIRFMIVGLVAAGSWLAKDLTESFGGMKNIAGSFWWGIMRFGQLRRHIPLLNRL